MKTEEQNTMIHISLKDVVLEGFLHIPVHPKGLVLFSHGSGSGRLSPRNNYVANILQQKGMATLLFDLLTESEDKIYENRFDIDKLTQRLIKTTQWAQEHQQTKELPIAYFGASTGAASALRAAAFFGNTIKAVVSRGGRPDLAMDELYKVKAPTLLVVGSLDTYVISLNQRAYENLKCKKKLEIIPDAGHLFEEPGKLREVADVSSAWLLKWFEKIIEGNV
ncbi:alpha/beta hydrolase [Muricauda sp. TY007]|uniref:dienelactone hydrolase family protein n=1 Tax=Allomuricauda sp. TY007 TaxID=2683200 RepID=UPI0013C2385C|nr:alpha/beta family hydrolase [Muricauda sp. TY007]NDV16233.1 alpha/beta hydrolase [Muricauda sp. TY007]